MKIALFFSYYDSGDSARQAEIDKCLSENIANAHIAAVYILVDDDSTPPTHSEKQHIIKTAKRPTYNLWLELTQELVSGEYISVLCNSDIFFDSSVARLPEILSEEGRFVCLSRWDDIGTELKRHTTPHWSQDAWALRADAPITQGLFEKLNFPLGVPRCDNRLAYLFAIHGWRIVNPVDYVIAHHVHTTELRTYNKKLDDRIIGGCAYVYPWEENTLSSQLDIDIWVYSSLATKSFKINPSLEEWRKEYLDSNKELEQPINSRDSWVVDPELVNSYVNSRSVDRVEASITARESWQLEAFRRRKDWVNLPAGFAYLEFGTKVIFYDKFRLTEPVFCDVQDFQSDPERALLSHLVRPTIDSHLYLITDRPKSVQDDNFWQYPCSTEYQAYQNHVGFCPGDGIDIVNKLVSVYLPLPFASYIDRRVDHVVRISEEVVSKVRLQVGRYRELAKQLGYSLRVHSVCQHVRWTLLKPYIAQLGIDHLHLSHFEDSSESELSGLNCDVKLHAWPLIAVNFEVPERSSGLQAKPMTERALLASFIGAHMPHYRSDIRLQIAEALGPLQREDLFIDLGDAWHFNKVVYDEQVLNKDLDLAELEEHDTKTYRYNQVLSDSRFSLCPEGAGPNTLRFWESMAIGSIPVVFSSNSVCRSSKYYSDLIGLIIVWKHAPSAELIKHLEGFDEQELTRRSNKLRDLYKKIRSDMCYENITEAPPRRHQ